MSLEDDLTTALMDVYQRAGKEVGYWGRRFLQSVRGNGGLATAKRMLAPRAAVQRAGLDALLDAGRPDRTLEAIVLQPKYRKLFTEAELSVAAERLGEHGKTAVKRLAAARLFPDELEPKEKYVEGARKQVLVNAYERDPRARNACLKKHGLNCAACGFNFEARYGALGKGFIHVHHLKPLALTDGEYELDPVADLRPVCPNCHAMLHHREEIPGGMIGLPPPACAARPQPDPAMPCGASAHGTPPLPQQRQETVDNRPDRVWMLTPDTRSVWPNSARSV